MGARHGAVALVVAALFAGCGGNKTQQEPPAAPDTISFSTPDFEDGAAIPKDLTCDGAGRRPTLVWRDLPEGAIELVLVVYDRDADFTHWTAWGIAASSGAGLAPNGEFPAGVKEGENSAGKPGWTPPCPPKGDDAHHYTFSLYAVDKGLTLEPGASPEQVDAALKGALGRGTFSGTYSRR
ncbi:MAG TPA: YbhB/YbcL family Raf kinase inhibitor-like protein [Solirubrobacter sp.]|nr:YbhB/YbcL family Raf kinase inhibitor-like protein [Solirubrobacter sp.]